MGGQHRGALTLARRWKWTFIAAAVAVTGAAAVVVPLVLAPGTTRKASPKALPSLPPSSTPRSSTPPPTTAPTTAPPTVAATSLRTVDWSSVTVPGSVCQLPDPITLHGGSATESAPSLHSVTPDVIAYASLPPTYGDLFGTGGDNVAALDVSCANTGGTADGQFADTWVIYASGPTGPKVLATFTPQEPSDLMRTHAAFFEDGAGGITIRPEAIVVKEDWWGPVDTVCCASGRATTTWAYSNGAFAPSTTVTQPTAPLPTFTDTPPLPTLSGHTAVGLLMALDPTAHLGEFSIDCEQGVPTGTSSQFVVDLSKLSFGWESDPSDPAAGTVTTVSLGQWEQDAAHDGWYGYLYLDQNPPLLSNGPGAFSCPPPPGSPTTTAASG